MSGLTAGTFDRWLDGLLPEEERVAFEARLRVDAELARSFERERALQERIDDGLVRAFGPAADLAGVVQAALADADSRPGGRTSRRWLVVGLALAAGVLAVVGLRWRGGAGPEPAEPVSVASLYGEVKLDPVGPMQCMAVSFEALLATTELERALTCGTTPSVEPGGVHASTIWPTATLVYGWKDDQLVVLVIDEAQRERRVVAGGGLFAHRRALGALVIYELSPFAEPQLLTELVLAGGR